MAACGRVRDDRRPSRDLEIGAGRQKALDDRLLPRRDQRADVEVGVGRTDPQRPVALGHALDHLAIALSFDQDAGGRRAGLPGVLHARVDQERHGAVEVGVGEDELGRFPAEFQRHGRDMPGGRRLDQRSDGDRSGERQMADAGMGGERCARLLAEARHDIEGAVRKARLAGEIGERERSEAGLLRRLQDAGVAHRQRRADRAAGDLHRIVPRHDMAGHPMRLAQGVDGVAVEIGNGLAHQLVGRAGVELHVARHRQRRPRGLASAACRRRAPRFGRAPRPGS